MGRNGHTVKLKRNSTSVRNWPDCRSQRSGSDAAHEWNFYPLFNYVQANRRVAFVLMAVGRKEHRRCSPTCFCLPSPLSRRQPGTELAFPISLSRSFVSLAEMLPVQQDSWGHHRVIEGPQENLLYSKGPQPSEQQRAMMWGGGPPPPALAVPGRWAGIEPTPETLCTWMSGRLLQVRLYEILKSYTFTGYSVNVF